MIYNDPPHGNIDWDGAPGHAKTHLVLPIAYKVLVVPKVFDLMLLLIPVSIRNSTAPSPRVPNRCNPTKESITRHTQSHIHCVVGKSLPNKYFILAKYKSLARVGKYMANTKPINAIRAERLIETIQSQYSTEYYIGISQYKAYTEKEAKALSAKALRKSIQTLIERMSQLEGRHAFLTQYLIMEDPLPLYYKFELIDLLV
jgi:hypothetical protein